MSDLSFIERRALEQLFDMGSGYVLGFSNRTFAEFVTDSVQRDIYSAKYDYASGSKANLLRRFWEVEPNHVVGKLAGDLIDIACENGVPDSEAALVERCRRIVERLKSGAPVDELEAVGDDVAGGDLDILVRAIRRSIDANEPEEGLDRLHTFVTKFLRGICSSRGIETPRDKPLHSLLGEYIKKLKEEGAIETLMGERILKTSISNLEAFNSVRNNHSFAHDNPVLNYEESLLIFNNVMSAIRYLRWLETSEDDKATKGGASSDDADFPF